MIQEKVKSTSMRISSFWKDSLDQRYHDIVHEVVRIAIALRGYDIDNVKTGYFPYYRQHELFLADLPSHHFWDVFTGGASFRGLLQFRGKPLFVTKRLS
jgi:hypothetical protein